MPVLHIVPSHVGLLTNFVFIKDNMAPSPFRPQWHGDQVQGWQRREQTWVSAGLRDDIV